MTTLRLLASTVILALAAAGCADSGLAPSGDGDLDALLAGTDGERTAHEPRGGERTRSGGGNAVFEDLASEIRGFGGLYRTERCAVTVVLIDLSAADEAIESVRRALEPRVAGSCPDGLPVSAASGEFTYRELVRYLGVAYRLLESDGVHRVRLDFELNRVLVHVESDEVAARVRAALPSAGVPSNAFVIQVRGEESTRPEGDGRR